MRKPWIAIVVLVAYSAILVRLLVFKNVLFEIGHLRFKFSSHHGRANIIPFKTILSYLRGDHGWFIGAVNLVGNIALFVPIGVLVSLLYPRLTWPRCLAVALAVGLAFEGMELAFHVGEFDIDDLLLNGLGVMIGYWALAVPTKRAFARA